MKEIQKPDANLVKLLPSVKLQPDVTYVPSQFAFPFEHNGKQYVFNTLTSQCLEGALPDSAFSGAEYDELISSLFLVPIGKNESDYYTGISTLMRAFAKKKGISGYTIIPTMGCNARCVYCFEEGMKPVTMARETVEQVIRFIIESHADGVVDLNWFGGEPLLHPDIIDRICEGLRQAGLEYTSKITSNGSLATPEIVAKMARDWHIKRVQISMDGCEEDYILRKQYYSYRDYYHSVMESVSCIATEGIPVIIRCNVDEENWDSIPCYLSDLAETVICKKNVGVCFVPLFDVQAGPKSVEMWETIRQAHSQIEEAGFIPVHNERNLNLRFRTNHCMADGGGVVIGPDGSLYPCEHCPEEARYGDIWQGTTDEAARLEFCRVDRTREKCRTCSFLPYCTNFASCPVKTSHCQEVVRAFMVDALRDLVDNRVEEQDMFEAGMIIC